MGARIIRNTTEATTPLMASKLQNAVEAGARVPNWDTCTCFKPQYRKHVDGNIEMSCYLEESICCRNSLSNTENVGCLSKEK